LLRCARNDREEARKEAEMLIIIEIVDIKVLRWTVDVENQNVTVEYQLMKSDGTPYTTNIAVFWATMPGGTQETYWYQLPAEYVIALTNITNDARTALLATIA
jgi:hypothetical protein